MNLDRAIFAFAGTMILASLALGHFVSPWWHLLTAFVGLNLLQSSFTGFCPAAMRRQAGILDKYDRWWAESLGILRQYGSIHLGDGCAPLRPEERRVGKTGVGTSRSRVSPDHYKN